MVESGMPGNAASDRLVWSILAGGRIPRSARADLRSAHCCGFFAVGALISGPWGTIQALTHLSTQWGQLLLCLPLCLLGPFNHYGARQFHLRARRAMVPAITSFDGYARGQYVLYLRTFDKDTDLGRTAPLSDRRQWWSLGNVLGYIDAQRSFQTTEERNVAELSRFGRVVAVGRPGEELPFLGADRVYVTDRYWKTVVTEAMKNARLVVLVAALGSDRKRYEGTLWEYTEALRLMSPQQVVLLVQDSPNEYENFRREATKRFRRQAHKKKWRKTETTPDQAPELPPFPRRSPHGANSRDWPLRGLIRFDEEWRSRLCLPEAAGPRHMLPRAMRIRRAFHTQIIPELNAVEDGLPGKARVGHVGVFRLGFHLVVLLPAALFAHWWWFSDQPVTVRIFGVAMTVSGVIGVVRMATHLNRAYKLSETVVTD
ncbi:hypothetical protein OEB94_03640 [Streptomyces sp. ICN988]|uniref:hypothetical protein n=1 Tax=Streptomyces sp. ICN988 TaxID=2983765 RepID=UPI0021E3B3D5|nr:hypothetical protein [Streptomyces sp. ICN988]MCV2458375.1 hypothetical protein [Streptomyces sp. ICN988]